MRYIVGSLTIVVFCLTLVAQEQEKTQVPQESQIVTSAIDNTIKKEAFVFSGKSTSGKGRRFGIRLDIAGASIFEGSFSGRLDKDGRLYILTEVKKNAFTEIYKIGDKIVTRQTWTGKHTSIGEFPSEICSVLDLQNLKDALEEAKNFRKRKTKKVKDIECHVITCVLPENFLLEQEDEDEFPIFRIKLFKIKKIKATFYIGKEDNLLYGLKIIILREFAHRLRIMPPLEEPEEEEEPKEEEEPGFKITQRNIYEIKFEYPQKVKEVKIPKDLKKLLSM